MKIAVGSDMDTHLTTTVIKDLEKRGYSVDKYGALDGTPGMWPAVAVEVARKVAAGEYEQAILFCWTGTGISLAANKIKGIRAALCQDAETARGAKLWNDANILAMSLRSVSEAVAEEILDAWFSNSRSEDAEDVACLRWLEEFEDTTDAKSETL